MQLFLACTEPPHLYHMRKCQNHRRRKLTNTNKCFKISKDYYHKKLQYVSNLWYQKYEWVMNRKPTCYSAVVSQCGNIACLSQLLTGIWCPQDDQFCLQTYKFRQSVQIKWQTFHLKNVDSKFQVKLRVNTVNCDLCELV